MGKPKVVNLHCFPDSNVVEMLRGAQTRAEAGETRAVAIVEVRPNGDTATQYCFGDDSRPYASLLGALQVLSHRIIEENR